MTDGLIPSCDHTTGCITCGDEAVRMQVVRIDAERELALCATRGRRRPEHGRDRARVSRSPTGITLLVHAGTAIAHAGSEVAA